MALKGVLIDLDDTLHDKSRTLERMAGRQHTLMNLGGLAVRQEHWVQRARGG